MNELMTSFNIEFLLFIIFLLIIVICPMLILFLRNNDSKLQSDEYVTSVNNIDQAIQFYKIELLNPRIEKLKQNINLNNDSQTNAVEFYNKTYNDILNHCCKDFIENYITKKQKKTLNKYFTDEYLVLYTYSKLKGNS
ncbi:MAG: hypothetical protein ACOC22_02030 [bacterium]